MNWSDERYVKLYTRQTATWRMWPWQARCVFPLLLQVSDGAGLIDVGRRDPIAALSVLVMVPREVVEVGLSALTEDGTLEVVAAGYLIPKFLEAQEATKTERLKKADQRAGRRAKAREIPRVPVPTCPEVSRLVPPSPAQPTTSPPPAQPRGEEARPLQMDLQPPDPSKPIETWDREDFWRWAECKRRRVGLPPEKWPVASKLRDWWQEARPAADVEVLQEAYLRFGDKPHWQDAKPALPFAGFMSCWNEFLPVRRTA